MQRIKKMIIEGLVWAIVFSVVTAVWNVFSPYSKHNLRVKENDRAIMRSKRLILDYEEVKKKKCVEGFLK